MYRTITIGSCISVQGRVVGETEDGRVKIRVGEKIFEGYPVDIQKNQDKTAVEV